MILLRLHEAVRAVLLPVVAAALVGGGIAWLLDAPDAGAWLWIAGTALVLASLTAEIVISLGRREFGLDLIAALAMAGALALGENLAGIIVALMYTGGEALERFAQRRAQRELTSLLARMPRSAARYENGELHDVDISEIAVGDRIMVRRGEVVPVDGLVRASVAVIDQSALTGEALPVRRAKGEAVMSGTTNAGDAFDLEVTDSAEQSTYAGIVRMVRAAQEAKAPMSRLADRYALLFLAVTLAIAGAAWLFSGDPVRALAVLVVATPCPLILAVPVAIVSGVSRCARNGVLVKGGGALERLAAVGTVVLDKTGTVTDGRARLIETRAREGYEGTDLLRLAASADQGSHHVVARALVTAARERGLTLSNPTDMRETPGAGLVGRVEGHEIAVGGWDFVAGRIELDDFAADTRRWLSRDGTVAVAVGIDGRLAGAFLLADQLRSEAGSFLRALRAAGVERIVLATGDRRDIAEGMAAFLPVDAFFAEMSPRDKIDAVEAERGKRLVMMVGDGVNDAPALAAADIGVAMGVRGAAASSEAADVVILVDRLDRLAKAMRIARRSRSIALQSVYAGIGMSLAAMIVAAFGYLTPVQGALLQEVIDVIVILNALRALRGPLWGEGAQPRLSTEELTRLEAEHLELAETIDEIGATAARLPHLSPGEARERLQRLDALLARTLKPHEKQDDTELFAGLAGREEDRERFMGMSRSHAEIQRYLYSLTAMLRALDADGPDAGQRYEFVRLLHGLEAITRLHFAQEEEIYRALEGS